MAAMNQPTSTRSNPSSDATAPPVVVITGASGGIGRATACVFAKHGWRVALLARGADGLEGARRDVLALGGQALVVQADVADEHQVEAAASRVEAAWGHIDVWVNNAMATVFAEAATVDPADFRRATEVSYLGVVWGTLAALRRMSRRGRGCIVQVGSALAYRSIPLQAAYCGAKSAVRGFTDSLRCELEHHHSPIRLTMVHLSAFNTPQFDWGRSNLRRRARPMGKVFQPELAARAIYHAARRPRREWWVGWPALQAALGQRVIPGWLDTYLARTAVSGQQTNEPVPDEREDNLWRPVAGDHGARGRFSAEARNSSLQHWLSVRRGPVWLAIAAAALAGGVGAGLLT